ncbi:hypothetical protein HBI81_087000 [Parastagonospora nodorum]|nr:hypothetical protein HBH53_066360 [Parastagonospora nodorum]KAH3999681.1 hypothetical protein HBI10_113640 [Parastagonospora nodorum]KAH4014728.1 hypothetical protein HBI13_169960 [Parastagonospora nodorum]KAH4035155.1 hypothetical protein HBI09_096090 [Parastagonospora nodorum]KAH4172462.1 hypothetical protein HBH43_090360 [Parastagonospora nodorum]
MPPLNTTPQTLTDDAPSAPPPHTKKRPNAFTELMSISKKSKPAPTAEDPQPSSALSRAKNAVKGWDPRNGLGVYLDKPETNPEGRVVEWDEQFVVIRDKFPKASVHLLLIPRNPDLYFKHPLHLLSSDTAFLADCRKRVERVKALAAQELRRQFGHVSVADKPYQNALDELMCASDGSPTEERIAALPQGRDWSKEIVAGVHTHPSMNHLHIHVFSRDMHSACMKHKKHYLSFNSSFLVQMDEFPLQEGSERFAPGDWPTWGMKCWRCDKGFANKFARLKEHLDDEFEEWKKE